MNEKLQREISERVEYRAKIAICAAHPEENIAEGATYFDMDNDACYRYENGKWNKKWPLEGE